MHVDPAQLDPTLTHLQYPKDKKNRNFVFAVTFCEVYRLYSAFIPLYC